MFKVLAYDVWRTRLERQGHRVSEPDWEAATGFTLWPDRDSIVTVAVEPDATMYPEYRERFYRCEPAADWVFCVIGCPKQHKSRWLELVSRQPPGYWHDFLAGPGSWVLSRLARFREVVVWANRGLSWDGLDNPTHRDWGMEVPAE